MIPYDPGYIYLLQGTVMCPEKLPYGVLDVQKGLQNDTLNTNPV